MNDEHDNAQAEMLRKLAPASATCQHCERRIVLEDGAWIDPEATGDDSVWRETCDRHDTFIAEHEPAPRNADVNPHSVDPKTGKPWPVESHCCSFHYPPNEETAEHSDRDAAELRKETNNV